MKRYLIPITPLLTMTTACQHKNPFLTEYDTPFHSIPFDQIAMEDYTEALDLGLKQQEEAVNVIASNPQAPTFDICLSLRSRWKA